MGALGLVIYLLDWLILILFVLAIELVRASVCTVVAASTFRPETQLLPFPL